MVNTLEILKRVIPADSLRLGSLVLDIEDPLARRFEVAGWTPKAVQSVLQNYSQASSRGGGTGLDVFLTDLFSAGGKMDKSLSVDLSCSVMTSNQLDDTRTCFEALFGRAEVRKWVQDCVEEEGPFGFKLYLVVGIHTVKDVTITVSTGSSWNANTSVTVPVTAIIGDPLAVFGSPLASPGISITRDAKKSDSQSFNVDDMIYAVRYRRIKMRWFRSKQVEKDFFLDKKTRWRTVEGTRGGRGAEDEPRVDILDVDLCDGLVNSEDDEEQGDGDKIKFIDADGNEYHHRLQQEGATTGTSRD
ncbi:hypothetical protein LTR84_008514 [Exophiala bonariae]|uniref:Uncharacterized protein n=1 Tax=Exophiala bonariae TaxID=1690606 RepID=A0AAV9MZ82_9EURO|nr:hypothetical protein LTR84_008514 [Exophiala bonariae]